MFQIFILKALYLYKILTQWKQSCAWKLLSDLWDIACAINIMIAHSMDSQAEK